MAKEGMGVGLTSLSIGIVFIYGGVKGYSPLKAIQNIIQGRSGSHGQSASLLTDTGGSNSSLNIPSNLSGNKAIGQQLASQYGWGSGQEWDDLVALWDRESGWNERATNPTSGAYGIPQALPASKMASAGSDWQSNAATQIKWGLNYIKTTYGSPSAAWAHEQSAGWY